MVVVWEALAWVGLAFIIGGMTMWTVRQTKGARPYGPEVARMYRWQDRFAYVSIGFPTCLALTQLVTGPWWGIPINLVLAGLMTLNLVASRRRRVALRLWYERTMSYLILAQNDLD